MQIYLPAIEGHVPTEMVQALRALIDFIYIAWHDIIDTNSLKAMDDALERFHKYRKIFVECGVCPTGFNHILSSITINTFEPLVPRMDSALR